MGWLALLLMAVATFAGLVALRIDRRLWSMAGAALMLAAAGYAWQGQPSLPASDAQGSGLSRPQDDVIIDLRNQMFGRFGLDGAYLTAADALARAGNPRYEVEAILGGIRSDGTSAVLWTALGDALARHDRQLSPASQLAFARAVQLSPNHPGPVFFRGLAQLRVNDFAGAERSWRQALALTPADAPYRDAIAQRIGLLQRLRQSIDA